MILHSTLTLSMLDLMLKPTLPLSWLAPYPRFDSWFWQSDRTRHSLQALCPLQLLHNHFLCGTTPLPTVPDVHAFAQAWTIYTALRCASTNDPNPSTSLGSFLIIIIDQDTKYYWPAMAKFVLSVCEQHFGYATAANWADKDLGAWQENLGSLPHRDIAGNKQSPTKASTTVSANSSSSQPSSKQQCKDISTQVCFHYNSSGCPDGNQCQCWHMCEVCKQQHPCLLCPDLAAATWKLQP
ncbi:hypothetical protein [Sporisorium scitamineum]|uniref:C3H1-type domain-containing protein n=1 Tax=Sporisorium scitamineum TaxID=49012 RepID=A0A0F7SAK3_9BASI|nr:hypothetical protein [Sporisorium scitamineum]